jgi:hypothetical protein
MSSTEILSTISNLAIVTFGNILDDTVVFSCIDIMLQSNNAIHLGRDPSLLLCGSTLCGQVMAALDEVRAHSSSETFYICTLRP